MSKVIILQYQPKGLKLLKAHQAKLPYPSLPKSSKYLVRRCLEPPKSVLRRCLGLQTLTRYDWKTRATFFQQFHDPSNCGNVLTKSSLKLWCFKVGFALKGKFRRFTKTRCQTPKDTIPLHNYKLVYSHLAYGP